jgi:hypothetical protein
MLVNATFESKMKYLLVMLAGLMLISCSQPDKRESASDLLSKHDDGWLAVHAEVFGIGRGNEHTLTLINQNGEVVHLSAYTPWDREKAHQDVFIGLTYDDPNIMKVNPGSELEQCLITIFSSSYMQNCCQDAIKPCINEFQKVLLDRSDFVWERDRKDPSQALQPTVKTPNFEGKVQGTALTSSAYWGQEK